MGRNLAGHLRANAVAYLALFVALSGTSYAAVTITGRSVKDGSLTGADVRDASITGRDVRSGSVGRDDLAAGALVAGPKGDTGPGGPAGPAGPKGETGTVDTSGFYDKAASDERYVLRRVQNVGIAEAVSIPPSTPWTRLVECPGGSVPARGRFEVHGLPRDEVTATLGPAGYDVRISNNTTERQNGAIQIGVSCIDWGVPDPSLPPLG